MNRIIEVDQDNDKAIRMTLGEEIVEVIQEHIKIKISEDRMTQEDVEEIIDVRAMTEKKVGVGLEKDHIWIIIGGEIGVVIIVDQNQDQGKEQIEIELCVISIGNMITSQKIALSAKRNER